MKFLALLLIFINIIPIAFVLVVMPQKIKKIAAKFPVIFRAIEDAKPIINADGRKEGTLVLLVCCIIFWFTRGYGCYLIFYCSNQLFFPEKLPIQKEFYINTILSYLVVVTGTLIAIELARENQFTKWSVESFFFKKRKKVTP